LQTGVIGFGPGRGGGPRPAAHPAGLWP